MSSPDYIIIGAGSAGCVLAHRLSADPGVQVLLLEAGGRDWSPLIRIPNAYARLFRTNMDWGFHTKPQEQVNSRRIYLPRGKVLGGCSTTNAMAYVRGNQADYDDWAALGNTGWSFQDVLPYFIRSEHNEQAADLDEGYHGTEGPLNVTFAQKFQTLFATAFVDACTQADIPFTPDYNGAEQTGAGYFQFTIKNQARHSAANAFLKPALKRPNLRIITRAHVEEIILENDRATGVRFRRSNRLETVKVKREVLLSAGAFQSPQLLMLSGIGDREELTQHGIECKKELSGVGKNLQDHLFYPISATSGKRVGQNHNIKTWPQLKALLKFQLFRSGPLTISPLEAVAFFNQKGEERVDTQFHFAPFHVGKGYDYDFYNLDTLPTDEDGFTILPTLLRPKSRGYIRLNSADPQADPLINPRFFSEETDLEHLVGAGQKALEVLAQPAFTPFVKEIVAPWKDHSDEALAAHIRQSVETVYHPVGTCKMGEDEMAVVDDQLRVHGIEGLRVVDASIMPTIVSGNTNAPVYMIAEKAADMILYQ